LRLYRALGRVEAIYNVAMGFYYTWVLPGDAVAYPGATLALLKAALLQARSPEASPASRKSGAAEVSGRESTSHNKSLWLSREARPDCGEPYLDLYHKISITDMKYIQTTRPNATAKHILPSFAVHMSHKRIYDV
jgi:hypothetical protein